MDRERVSPVASRRRRTVQHFARTHAIGQVVPGKVTKLVPWCLSGVCRDGIEGLGPHLRAGRAPRELPEQVVTGSDIFVKVIDIDPERRRISPSPKQANRTAPVRVEFDPTLPAWAVSMTSRATTSVLEGFPITNMWSRGVREAAGDLGEAVRRRPRLLGGALRSRRLPDR